MGHDSSSIGFGTREPVRTVRFAGERDIPACAGLLGILFSQEHEFRPDPEVQAKALDTIVRRPEVGRIFVCEEAGRIIGMVSMLFSVSTALGRSVAMLEDMIVSPGYRGKGIGSLLADHACRWARSEGIARITLLTDGDNEAAHRFYESQGFIRSGMVVFRKAIDGDLHPAPSSNETTRAMNEKETSALQAWICTECGFVYDPSTGDLESHIRPGVPFEKLPDDWLCPVCSVTRDRFRPFDSQL